MLNVPDLSGVNSIILFFSLRFFCILNAGIKIDFEQPGIFEISALAKPSILVPLANSAQNHQIENAYSYAENKAAIVLEEENFTPHFLIEKLKHLGLEIWMITGDHEVSAKTIASKAGIENVLFEILPNEKSDQIKALQANGKIVGAIGDGVNDAPMLAQADVGIAMRTGSDIAIESGHIVLMHNDIMDVYNSIRLSKKTLTKIKQNLFWAFIYNILGIPIAAGILYPLGFSLNPIIAAGAMAFSSTSVVLNSLIMKLMKF